MKKIFITGLCLIALQVFSQGPFSIGTIPPGDSIVIYYTVTVNTPLVPPNAPSISNQGSVTVNGGAAILTDDPDTAPAGDATVTLLNSFPLPVTLTEFNAYEKRGITEIAWTTLTEINTLKYVVEKSAEGTSFSSIGEVAARGGTGTLHYFFTHPLPFPGDNFYRLKITDQDGSLRYTRVVRVVTGNVASNTLVYPNPVTGRQLNIELRNTPKGRYLVTLYSISGQASYTVSLYHSGGSSSQVITLPASVTKGLYHIQVTGEQNRFLKTLLID